MKSRVYFIEYLVPTILFCLSYYLISQILTAARTRALLIANCLSMKSFFQIRVK